MPAAYVILLAVSLGATWIYTHTSEDIPFVLAALTALVCFLWGFSCAPWAVQLLILVLLFRLYKFYVPDEQRLN